MVLVVVVVVLIVVILVVVVVEHRSVINLCTMFRLVILEVF